MSPHELLPVEGQHVAWRARPLEKRHAGGVTRLVVSPDREHAAHQLLVEASVARLGETEHRSRWEVGVLLGDALEHGGEGPGHGDKLRFNSICADYIAAGRRSVRHPSTESPTRSNADTSAPRTSLVLQALAASAHQPRPRAAHVERCPVHTYLPRGRLSIGTGPWPGSRGLRSPRRRR